VKTGIQKNHNKEMDSCFRRNDRKMVWIPDAVYPCEACPCESREQGVGAGMTDDWSFRDPMDFAS